MKPKRKPTSREKLAAEIVRAITPPCDHPRRSCADVGCGYPDDVQTVMDCLTAGSGRAVILRKGKR